MMMTPSTPCIDVCTLDRTQRFCLGCGRTIEEIGAWSGLDEAHRRAIMAQLPERLGARRATAARETVQ